MLLANMLRNLSFKTFKVEYNFIESCCPKAMNNTMHSKGVRLGRVPDNVIKICLGIQNWNKTNEVASQVGLNFVRLEIKK